MKKQDLENAEQFLADVKKCADEARDVLQNLLYAVRSNVGTVAGFPVYMRDYWVARFCDAEEDCERCSDLMFEMLKMIKAEQRMKDIANVDSVYCDSLSPSCSN